MRNHIEDRDQPKKTAKKKKAQKEMPRLDRYRDRDVHYFGVPYARSKFVKGVWFMRRADGSYTPFPIQERVIEMPKKYP